MEKQIMMIGYYHHGKNIILTGEKIMIDCQHEFEQKYYDLRCVKCDLFYPDNSNWFAPLDYEDEEEYHSYNCTCENCLQNHPERDILYNNSEYFTYPDDEDQ